MNEPSENQTQAAQAENKKVSTFESIFFGDNPVPICVPDYQRAFSWEDDQIKLFIEDLVKCQSNKKGYYFGHFITEEITENIGPRWEIVDGQQRITTFVLFLMVCQLRSKDAPTKAYSLIKRFFTVSYDREALEIIRLNFGAFLEKNGHFDGRPPDDEQIIKDLLLPKERFTRSQRKMVLVLLRFHVAFQKGDLNVARICEYITVVMDAQCSLHTATDKSVAVNIFELHNSRGVPLTTLEKVKAKLMKFVYDHGGEVEKIQDEFGQIYGMEERLATNSFRGEMEMEHLLRLHLRVVDDGTKRAANEFDLPRINANAEKLVEYVDSRLHDIDGEKTKSKIKGENGVKYALNLSKELKKSVRIVSEHLPEWDKKDPLVGDVLILDQDLSCQFFLIICRRSESGEGNADKRIGTASLMLWEKLLFTRDFHEKYHYLSYRDNFPALFATCGADEERTTDEIRKYLADGFRPWDVTQKLQSIVYEYLKSHEDNILNGAFYWWKSKMIYAIYKYEIKNGANIRSVMKGTSVEHILPLEWQLDWVEDKDVPPRNLSETERKSVQEEIGSYINGIGNLLLLTPGENTSQGNNHPADKRYEKYCEGGTYKEHDENPEKWRSSKEWSDLIRIRGKKIFNFMLSTLVGTSENPRSSLPNEAMPGN